MRVMINTNVLFSAIIFPKGVTAKVLNKCLKEHDILVPIYVIDELKRVIAKKFPNNIELIDAFLKKQSFELVYTPDNIPNNLFHIRDPKDYPVLYTAIIENVDVLITGDEDFKDTDVTHPEILSPAEFINKY